MKLLVIVLCLLIERYWGRGFADYRMSLLRHYLYFMSDKLTDIKLFSNNYVRIVMMLTPPVILLFFSLCLFNQVLLGFIAFIIHSVVFYYCLGPNNPFYPLKIETTSVDADKIAVSSYFVESNTALFAVIFWYVLLGPCGILLYRLVSFSQINSLFLPAARQLTLALDWISARLTVLAYLLAGNFQKGFSFFSKMFFSSVKENDVFLETGGLLALQIQDNEPPSMMQAQQLVDSAVIIVLVFLAIFTLASWL